MPGMSIGLSEQEMKRIKSLAEEGDKERNQRP